MVLAFFHRYFPGGLVCLTTMFLHRVASNTLRTHYYTILILRFAKDGQLLYPIPFLIIHTDLAHYVVWFEYTSDRWIVSKNSVLLKSFENILRRTPVNLISKTKYAHNDLSFTLYGPFEYLWFLMNKQRVDIDDVWLAIFLPRKKRKKNDVIRIDRRTQHSIMISSTTAIDEYWTWSFLSSSSNGWRNPFNERQNDKLFRLRLSALVDEKKTAIVMPIQLSSLYLSEISQALLAIIWPTTSVKLPLS